jgi:ABC-type Fe3+/spermidine/putrescine transport system ATPase subunit
VTNLKLLLLDEPLSSLDTEVRMNLQEAIRTIQRELGLTTTFVTHDLGEAMAMSDRMALLLNGGIAAHDKPEGCSIVRAVGRRQGSGDILWFSQGHLTNRKK